MKTSLHTFPRQVVKGYTASIRFSLSLMGYLPWKPAPRLWERQDSHVERPMQTATRSPADSQPQLPRNGSEPSRAFRLPASKLLQIMPTGSDVSYPLTQMQIQEQTKCWGGLLSVLQLHTAYRDLNSPTRNPTLDLAAGSMNCTREFPNTVVFKPPVLAYLLCSFNPKIFFNTVFEKCETSRVAQW